MPQGRPTKYKSEFCDQLYKHMKGGLSFESFAGAIQVNRDTLYEWAKIHDDFSDAKKNGSSASQLFWEQMGRSGAGGKIKGFQTGAWVFQMKNRFGWRDRQDVVTRDETLKNPMDMNDDELDERLAHALKVIEKYGTDSSSRDSKGSTKTTGKKTKSNPGKK